MRKSTKIAVVLAAAALLVAGFAFTTLAKGWVKEAEGLYYYEDAEGMKVYNEWQKDGANYYYLGDDGYMVTNQLVEYNNAYYWVGADGAKVAETWIQVPADQEDIDNYGVEYRWYYFQKSSGKAYTSKIATIDGKKYIFGADGKMLFGYVDGTNFAMETNAATAFDGALYNYYCGSNDEGWALTSEWRKETDVTDNGAYEDESSWWSFYQSSGKRAVANENGYIWKGQRYYFDANGKMLTGWKEVTVSTTPSVVEATRYFGGDDDGKMVKKAWAYVKPIDDGDDKVWFYFDGAGAALSFESGAVQKINSKFYAFAEAKNNASKMLAGTVQLSFEAGKADVITDAIAASKIDLSKKTLATWLADGTLTDDAVYYFSGDEANDGSLKKNVTFSQEFLDDTYTLAVGNDGKLKNGYMSKEKKYYRYGYLLAASEDMRYQVINVYKATVGDVEKDFALLGISGTEVTSGTVADADGSYYFVDKANNGKIYKADSSLLSAAKAAAAFKKDGGKEAIKIDGVEYYVKADDTDLAKVGYSKLYLVRK